MSLQGLERLEVAQLDLPGLWVHDVGSLDDNVLADTIGGAGGQPGHQHDLALSKRERRLDCETDKTCDLRTHPSVPDHVAEDLATLPGLHGPAAAILGADHYAVKATLSQASILEPLGRDSVAGSIASREGESSTRLVATSVTTNRTRDPCDGSNTNIFGPVFIFLNRYKG